MSFKRGLVFERHAGYIKTLEDVQMAGTLDVAGQLEALGIQDTPLGDITPSSAQVTDLTVHGEVLADVDFGGNYAKDLQNVQDIIAGKGPGYWFDGVDDNINLGTFKDSNLDFGTGDFSFIVDIKQLSDNANNYLVGAMEDTNNRWYINLVNGTDFLSYCKDTSVVRWNYNAANVIETGTNNTLAIIGDRSDSLKLFVNGKNTILTEADAITPGDVDTNAPMYLGTYGLTTFSNCEIRRFLQFNLALSELETIAYSSGAPVPYKYLGASQTAKITSDNSNFDTIGDWVPFGLATATGNYDSGDIGHDKCLRIEAGDASTEGVNLPVSHLVGGVYHTKLYLIKCEYKWIHKTIDGDVRFSSADKVTAFTEGVDGNWHDFKGVITAYSTLNNFGIHINPGSGHADDELLIDNITMIQIGCVLQDEPKGITNKTWYDSSGNNQDGTVTGAIVTNPTNQGWFSHNLNLDENRSNLQGKPTIVERGLFSGYSMPVYAANNEELWFRQRVPFNWDGVTAPTAAFITALSAAEDIGDKYKYQLEWASGDVGAVIPSATTETLTDEVVIVDGTAWYAEIVTFELTPTTLVAGQNLQMRLRRIASAAPAVSNEIVLLHWDARWFGDKANTPTCCGYL